MQSTTTESSRDDCTLVPIGAAQIREDPDQVIVASIELHEARQLSAQPH